MAETSIKRFKGLSLTDEYTNALEPSFGTFQNVKIGSEGFIEKMPQNNYFRNETTVITEFLIDQNEVYTQITDSIALLQANEDKPQVIELAKDQYLFNYQGESLDRKTVIIDENRAINELSIDVSQISNVAFGKNPATTSNYLDKLYWLDDPDVGAAGSRYSDMTGKIIHVSSMPTEISDDFHILIELYNDGSKINTVTFNIAADSVATDFFYDFNGLKVLKDSENNDIYLFCWNRDGATWHIASMKIDYNTGEIIASNAQNKGATEPDFFIDDTDHRLLYEDGGSYFEINKGTMIIDASSGTAPTGTVTNATDISLEKDGVNSETLLKPTPNTVNANPFGFTHGGEDSTALQGNHAYMGLVIGYKDGSFSPVISMGIGLLDPTETNPLAIDDMRLDVVIYRHTVEPILDTNNAYNTVSAVDTTTDQITFTVNHSLSVSDELIFFTEVTDITLTNYFKTTVSAVDSATQITISTDLTAYTGKLGGVAEMWVGKVQRTRYFDNIERLYLFGSQEDQLTDLLLITSLDISGVLSDTTKDSFKLYYRGIGSENLESITGNTLEDKISNDLKYRFIEKINQRTLATHIKNNSDTVDELATISQYTDILPQQLNPASLSIPMRNIKKATGLKQMDQYFFITDKRNAILLFDDETRVHLNAGTINYNALESLGSSVIYLRKDGLYIADYNQLKKITDGVFEDSEFALNKEADQGFSGAFDSIENMYIFQRGNDTYYLNLDNFTFSQASLELTARRLRSYNGTVYGIGENVSGTPYKVYRYFRAGSNLDPDSDDFSIETNLIKFEERRHNPCKYIEIEYYAENNIDFYFKSQLNKVLTTTTTANITVSGGFSTFQRTRIYITGAYGEAFKWSIEGTGNFKLTGFRYGR